MAGLKYPIIDECPARDVALRELLHEHVHCIAIDQVDHYEKQANGNFLWFDTWCGRRRVSSEFVFMDIDHAALNGRADGRLMACQDCIKAIYTVLCNGW